jgi:hypothetical protein
MGINIHDTPELYTNRVEVALMMKSIAEDRGGGDA